METRQTGNRFQPHCLITSLWEVELMETESSSMSVTARMNHHFPLGSGINGNPKITIYCTFLKQHHFPLGSGINGSLISRGL